MLHHLHMTVSIFLLFISYSSVQNLQSSLIPGNLGQWSLFSIYLSLCVTTLFFAGQFVAYFSAKWSIAIGGICYFTFILANLWPMNATLIPTAIVLGFGGGILWAGQGTYLTIASGNYAEARGQDRRSMMGTFTGIFFAIFQVSQVIGNLISSFILGPYSGKPPQSAVNILMYIYIAIAGIGCVSFLFMVHETPNRTAETEEEKKSTMASKLFRVMYLLKDPRMLLMIPIFFYCGVEQGYVFGSFTGDIITKSAGVGKVGFVMALFGAVDTIASYTMGKISDTWGNKIVLFSGFLAHLLFLVGFYVALKFHPLDYFGDHQYWLYLGACLLGVGDACMNTLPNLLCSIFFTNNAEAAFSNLKFFQSLGSVLMFAIGSYAGPNMKIVVTLGFLFMGVISMIYLHVFVSSIDSVTKKNEPSLVVS
eukprot:TRINITY_DN6291_c0_g1_i2.p1 TRINITY_DN6291_c0_g1~~TRINITY_DN6291_c0_g1_i2.p1  ORF type:complete len:464 (+),score=69.34 TRINITY_DN6291_c0_g1_i2:129-1394(+)